MFDKAVTNSEDQEMAEQKVGENNRGKHITNSLTLSWVLMKNLNQRDQNNFNLLNYRMQNAVLPQVLNQILLHGDQ